MGRSGVKKWLLFAAAVLMAGIGFVMISVRACWIQSFPASFSESAKALSDPDRGFYSIRAFAIRDMPQEFFTQEEPPEEAQSDPTLEMIQINLRRFRSGEITPTGMENLERLFEGLARRETRYILRFLYDWNGNADGSEPEDIEIVCGHMRQVGELLQRYHDRIFLLQGLFVGKWGEMNGTPFNDQQSLQGLCGALLEAVGEDIFLSVRTPAQWRSITQIANPGKTPENPTASQIGLFNDGMMGNSGDLGTYLTAESEIDRASASRWNREDELAFQEELCRYVPNGGEVVLDNPLNDFENALENLKTMHVSYLNRDYDTAVLEKWAEYTVEEAGCFQGMDGLTYIDRHLGYRYLLDSVELGYCWWRNQLRVTAVMKNVGFAPAYSEKKATVILKNGEDCLRLETSADLRELAGGNQSDQTLNLVAAVSLSALAHTEYEAYLQIWDTVADSPMVLANEQEPEELGYYLGRIQFAHVSWYDEMRSGMAVLGLK